MKFWSGKPAVTGLRQLHLSRCLAQLSESSSRLHDRRRLLVNKQSVGYEMLRGMLPSSTNRPPFYVDEGSQASLSTQVD